MHVEEHGTLRHDGWVGMHCSVAVGESARGRLCRSILVLRQVTECLKPPGLATVSSAGICWWMCSSPNLVAWVARAGACQSSATSCACCGAVNLLTQGSSSCCLQMTLPASSKPWGQTCQPHAVPTVYGPHLNMRELTRLPQLQPLSRSSTHMQLLHAQAPCPQHLKMLFLPHINSMCAGTGARRAPGACAGCSAAQRLDLCLLGS